MKRATVSEIIHWFPAFVSGLMLGVVFFGGLWWTVRKSLVSSRPGLWFFFSLLLRMSSALAGFYFTGHEHWQKLIMCLLGFLVVRFISAQRARAAIAFATASGQEVRDASQLR